MCVLWHVGVKCAKQDARAVLLYAGGGAGAAACPALGKLPAQHWELWFY
jgi:hypothetical protein